MPVAVAIPLDTRAAGIISECARLGSKAAVVEYLHHLSGDMPMRVIPRSAHKYLERYFISHERGIYSYLHRFVAGDGDKAVHNHPWQFSKSTILAGGYKEVHGKMPSGDQMPEYQICEYRAQDENIILSDDVHQIIGTEPETWTCFQHTEWVSDWGFYYVRDKHRHYDFELERGQGRNRMWWKRSPKGRDAERQPLIRIAA